ncbi:hypothetical protein MKJ04_21965 [Pontibacter sp. E15-1]|uniref:hypothetical protein n=1 Tax=Pontibacter sp. E15-1 TaxID=2919918 RepID=UPI001F4FB22D|nr:hypothetical protein [Pontibacter sp. E15-1]MCJ8167524.1 hypothetical protein [Pontibacter sp. E15-1]
MEDKLKKFAAEHREEFDVFEPQPELWQHICRELPHKPKEAKVISISFGDSVSFSANRLFMQVAAAIALLLGCGLTLLMMKQQAPESNNILAMSQAAASGIAPELAEVEAYYVSQIKEKKSELSAYDLKILGLGDENEIDAELARLDSSYIQLKQQLYTNPNTDEIMSAMIQNLQIRIGVLNRQLEVLQKIEKLDQQPDLEPKKDDTTRI